LDNVQQSTERERVMVVDGAIAQQAGTTACTHTWSTAPSSIQRPFGRPLGRWFRDCCLLCFCDLSHLFYASFFASFCPLFDSLALPIVIFSTHQMMSVYACILAQNHAMWVHA
jgi:hypothetical protein